MFNKKTLKSKTPKSRLQANAPHLTPDLNFELSGVSPPVRFESPGFEYQLQLPQPTQHNNMFYQNRPFLPPYNNQNAFYQSPTGLYRHTMDTSNSSQANEPYYPLNRINLDMDFEQLLNTQEYYQSQDYSMGQVEEMSPVKKPSKRPSRAKNNDGKVKEPAKDWTKAEEIALCQAWCDVSENSEKKNSMKVKGFWEAVINYFEKETGSTRGGSNDLDVYHKACAEYKMMYRHDFTLGHCYNILKYHQGWLEIEMPNFYKTTKGRKKSKTSETTSGSASGGFNLNDEADEYEEAREHRPLGRDAAKAKKKSFASSREGSSLFVDLVADKYLGIKSTKWERMKEQQDYYIQLKNRELDIQEVARKEATDLKREKLEIQRRKLQLYEKNKRDKDILVYNSVIDPSLPAIQQQKLQEMKNEIKETYNLDY
ncbi:ABC transporter G family member 7 isoform X2 [Tanacetum coccineum]